MFVKKLNIEEKVTDGLSKAKQTLESVYNKNNKYQTI